MRASGAVMLALCIGAAALPAKMTDQEKQVLVRDLTAEFGAAKLIIPRSKKPLGLNPDGTFDTMEWGAALNEFGPAARLGDLVQITKVDFKSDRLILELNYGIGGGRKWWHRIQVSGSQRQGTTLGQNQATHAPGGTELALIFEDGLPNKSAEEFLKLLKPVLDFEQRSATELYMDKLEPKYRQAIEKGEIIEGMDREMVLLAKKRPEKKYRETKDGVEREDWIYGKPPGDVVFVTFENGAVIRVKHEHANLGGEVRKIDPVER
ncbi:MAG: hypothetical protein H6509_09620 [Bryobacterales bacterium]|nr:hypothetical protein [Bryobacterales bacterium]